MSAAPRAVVVVTGSELVRGGRRDLNGPYLARELTALGLEPAEVVIVSDRPEELERAALRALRADVAVFSGGLGPTHDDRTVEFMALAAGRELQVDPDLEAEIEAFSRRVARRLNRTYHEFSAGVTKQATLPEGAVALGLAGTAPALLMEHDGRVAIALPGPPGELRQLWPAAVDHPTFRRVLERTRPREHRVLRLFGPSESAVAQAIEDAGGDNESTETTVCARDLEIHVDLFVEPDGAEHAGRLERALINAFPEQLFARDERSIEEIVLDLCRDGGMRLATAESCTGGLIGTRLTDVPGASDVYVGGVVAYSNVLKTSLLGVDSTLLETHGAVSQEAAEAMAAGARRKLGAEAAIAVTGIAGPDGGTPEKPVGLIFLHAEARENRLSREFQLPGDRGAVRTRAAVAAMHLLRRVLTRSDTDSRDSAG